MTRSPSIAKIFDVNTMNVSEATAKIAGIESTAKMISLSSTSRSAKNRGVADGRESRRTKKPVTISIDNRNRLPKHPKEKVRLRMKLVRPGQEFHPSEREESPEEICQPIKVR